MPIYKGSTKLGIIYHGSTKNGKVYKGSTLVYSGSTKNIPVYFVSDYRGSKFFTLGFPLSDGNLVVGTGSDTASVLLPIIGITGNLGESGSKITIQYTAGNQTYTFQGSFTDSYGNLFYRYNYRDFIYTFIFVSPKANIGDNALFSIATYCHISSDGKTLTYFYPNTSQSFAITNPTIVGNYIYRK